MRRMLYESRLVARRAQDLERLLLKHSATLIGRAAGSQAIPDPEALDGAFLIDLPAQWAGLDLAKQVRVRTGVARRMADRVLLPIVWEAAPGHLLYPRFEGTLELEPLRRDLTEVTLAGSYRTPMGILGGLVDVSVLHNVARDTAARLLDGLTVAMTDDLPVRTTPVMSSKSSAPMLVRDVMTADPLVVSTETSLRAAARLLFAAGISAVPVVGDDGGLVGVLSEQDLLAKEARRRYGFGRRQREEDLRRDAVTAGEACTRPALTVSRDAKLSDVTRELLDQQVSRLVVVHDSAVVGIITRHDVLEALIRDLDDVRASVREALHQVAADDATAEVDVDGHVVLSGTVSLRSVASRAAEAVSTVDGVMTVDSESLDWREDDILPLAGPI